jgi:hypothetical protein
MTPNLKGVEIFECRQDGDQQAQKYKILHPVVVIDSGIESATCNEVMTSNIENVWLA